MLQDREGYLWVGTTSGLVRFDGHRFVEVSQRCPNLRRASHFRALAAEKDFFWGGFMGGLVRVEHDRCGLFDQKDGLEHPFVHALTVAPGGGVWLGTGGTGVFRWNDGLVPHPAYENHPELPGKVLALLRGPQETLWVGTDHGLILLDGASATRFGEENGLPSELVQSLAMGTDGTLLVGTSSGLASLSGLSAGGLVDVRVPNTDVTALLLDQANVLWVGTASGLLRQETENNEISLTDTRTRVESLLQDASGDVWVGTADGLQRYQSGSFRALAVGENVLAIEQRSRGGYWIIDNVGSLRIVSDEGEKTILPPGTIRGQGMLDLEEDADRSLWIGAGDLLHVGEDGSLQSFSPDRGYLALLGPATADGRLVATTDGRGTSQLYIFDEGTFEPYLEELSLTHVQRMLRSRSGDLWLSSGGDGVHVVRDDGSVQRFSEDDGLPSNFARGMSEGMSGQIWVATSRGLARIEGDRIIAIDEDELPAQSPVQILRDSRGNLWVSADDGLYRIRESSLEKHAVDGTSEVEARRYTRRDGLLDLQVSWRPSGVLKTDRGDLLFAGPRGVSRYLEDTTSTDDPAPVVHVEEVSAGGRLVDAKSAFKVLSGTSLEVRFTVADINAAERLRFRYRLEGVDETWVEPKGSRTASYSALPHGNHRFLVSVRRLPGPWNSPTNLLDVRVVPRWHETDAARILGLITLLALFLGFHRLRLRHARGRARELARHVERKTRQLQTEVKERKRAELELLRLNADLDERVKDRTSALLSAHEQVQLSEARFALAAKGAENAIWEWDPAQNQLYCSPRWFEMLGLRKREMTPAGWLERVHPSDRDQVEDLFDSKELSFRLEYRIRHEHDRFVWVVCRGARTLDDEGNVLRAAGSQTDITKRKRFEGELIKRAQYDQLTGLPNRAHLLAHLQELKKSQTDAFAFFFFDLDRFKSINDSLGHLSGDELLVQMSERLKLAFEPSGMVSRLGGDEFAMVLPEARTEEAARLAVETLHSCMRAPFEVRKRLLYSTCSVGVCMSNQCEAISDFLKNADVAMYRAKQLGPGNTCFFSSELAQEAALHLELESDLRPAIEANEFELFYQPIVSTRRDATPRAEALVRWRHPKRGLLTPGQFLDIVEETGLSGLLTERVLQEACRALKQWSDAGRSVQLSVNISPDLFMQHRFLGDLQRILEETGAESRLLRLELLETHSIADVARLNRQLGQTRQLGVKVYMDDFGTGYSSLSYLTELDIDGFKMDRRFLRDLLNENRAVKVYEAIMGLARSLDLRVVAEGVERRSEFEILERAGCEWFQGFLFSKPLPKAEFEKFSFSRSSIPASFAE